MLTLAFAGGTANRTSGTATASAPPFHFVAYGDSRFHDPKDIEAANPAACQALVKAIAEANPVFISLGGPVTIATLLDNLLVIDRCS